MDPRRMKKRMYCFLLPRASANPERKGTNKALIKNAADKKKANNAVFLYSVPKKVKFSGVYNP